MKNLILDVEATGAINGTKGHPFSVPNRLAYVGIRADSGDALFDIEYGREPYGGKLDQIRNMVDNVVLICGFNVKYDLHWLRRYGIDNFQNKRVWDCQLFEFIKSNQRWRYPSLDATAEKYGLEGKLDNIKLNYWDTGLDTDEVPKEELEEYLAQDLSITEQVYLRQREELETWTPEKKMLLSLMFQDLLVLEEMEWNGFKYDIKESLEESKKISEHIAELEKRLFELSGGIPINWNSGDHVSSLLYGGTVAEKFRETFIFTYKDGRQKEKERWAIREHTLPRLVEPLPKTNLKKDGYWSTDVDILRKLKAKGKAREIISILIERSKLEKLDTTYYQGFPKLYESMMWDNEVFHGQLNQCVVVTGRLSCTKPNQQNLPPKARDLIVSRY